MNCSPQPARRKESGVARNELILACAALALGMFLLSGISSIPFGSGYDRIGPRFFPYAVAIGLFVLAGWAAAGAFRPAKPRATADGEGPPSLNWVSFAWLAAALVLSLALLDRAGFIIACSVQFWLAARAFHSRRPLRDAVVGVVLATVVYVAFSRLLGLTLPAGILEGIS